ncbi:MAG: UDP-N-acetylmuramyl pentapeptide phosphotransferase/UDP-N-acetylglucosamine-1-phosphate [Prolixibacteraceae bacterium]|nr:MAG: UDP-N-acetylmuramyl pentapeptide phosphotransferase/UDP-N-acetylglucosamine-1-phosphate [Prolixibacteraceae bacterium]
MLLYLFVFIILIVILSGYFRFALQYNIIDKPNKRSSHTYITIRGGGIVFPLAALLWFFLCGFGQPWLIFALLLLAVIGFWDDVITLNPKIRILIHFIAVTILFWQSGVLDLSWYIVLPAYLFTLGWVNAFNFMDGINGITAFYGLVALCSFLWLNNSNGFVSQDLIVILIISVVIFSFFNVRRRAKTFAGDVGSVSIAFLLAWFMISLIIKTGRLEYILFFAVYGIDSVFTILFRLWRRENIFDAHRTHLYQYLSNELKWPHVLVSGLYGLVQLIINITVIGLINAEQMTWTVFFIFLLVLSVGYLFIRKRISVLVMQKSIG